MMGSSLTILLYHGVDAGDTFQGTAAPRREEYILNQTLFEEHMDALAAQGYALLPLEQCVASRRAGDASDKTVVLTFDDGEESCY